MNALQTLFADCGAILPEIALVAFLCLIVLADVIMPRERARAWIPWIAISGLVLSLLMVVSLYPDNPVFARGLDGVGMPQSAFSGMIVNDSLGDVFKIVFILGTLAVVFLSMRSAETASRRPGEYYTMLLTTAAASCLVAGSNNFLMLLLAIETLSLASYALVGYAKEDRAGGEASMKYLLYGSVASGVMLFGISYLYGMAGTLDIRNAFFAIGMREDSGAAILLSMVLVMAGIGFKISAAPFHFWTPDVYQGAPTPITAHLSVVSKAAGFAALLRILLPFFALGGPVVPDPIQSVSGVFQSVLDRSNIQVLLWVLAAASMTIGNLVALRQTDVKRLLAYSSIAQAGYLLMAVTALNNAALEAVLFYFFVYLFTNLGAFLVVVLVRDRRGSTNIGAFRGLAYESPWLAILMFVFLISLTGLPPTAGFLGKLLLFNAVIGAGSSLMIDGVMTSGSWFFWSLAIIGAVNSAISLYYYVKVAKAMFFEKPPEGAPVFTLGLLDNIHLTGLYGAPVALMILNVLPFASFGSILDMTRIFGN